MDGEQASEKTLLLKIARGLGRITEAAPEAAVSAREFVKHAYHDPIWLVATAALLLVLPPAAFYLNALPEKVSEVEIDAVDITETPLVELSALTEMTSRYRTAMSSMRILRRFVIDRYRDEWPTQEFSKSCVGLAEQVGRDLSLAEGAVNGLLLTDPLMADLQATMQQDIACDEGELSFVVTACNARDWSKIIKQADAEIDSIARCQGTHAVRDAEFAKRSQAWSREKTTRGDELSRRVRVIKIDAFFAWLALTYAAFYAYSVLAGVVSMHHRRTRRS